MTRNHEDPYQRDGFIDETDVEHRQRDDQQENSKQESHDTSNTAQKTLRTPSGIPSVQNPPDVAPQDRNSYQQSNQLWIKLPGQIIPSDRASVRRLPAVSDYHG